MNAETVLVPRERVLAAYGEGMCPVHSVPLDAGMIRSGTLAFWAEWMVAGWCPACQGWWHRPVTQLMTGSLCGPCVISGDGRHELASL